jgi:transposase
MKKQTRRKFSSAFKAKVALEAVKNQQTLVELAKKFEINPVMISKWKAEFMENLAATFERETVVGQQEQDTEKLFAQIGQLKVENDFLKKSCKKLGIEI